MYIITKWTESVDFTLHLRGEHSMIINYKLQIEHIKRDLPKQASLITQR